MKSAWTILALGVVLACLAPVLALVWDSLGADSPSDSETYSALLSDGRQLTLFLRSALISAGATALALVFGTATGWAVARLRGVGGTLFETLTYLPLLLPSIVIVLGWVYFAGPAGALVQSGALYTPAGCAFVLALCFFPVISVLAAQAFRGVDPAALRAARLCAGPWARLWFLWRPLLAPYLATGALLVFLLCFSDFGVPSALTVNVYPIETFAQLSAYYDVKQAMVTVVPPLILAAALFLLRHAFARSAPWPSAGARAASEPVPRARLLLASLPLVLAVGLPLAFLVMTAGTAYADALRTAGEQVLVSLRVGALGALMLVTAGLVFALAYRGLSPRARGALEALVLLPLVVPGAAVGLGILSLVDGDVWPWSTWYPGESVVAYAGAARSLTFPALLLAAGCASLHRRLFQAAELAGAGPLRRATSIAAPLLWPALVAAGALSFVFCLGELSASVLINPPGTTTLPVRLASLLHFGQEPILAALCLVLVALVVAVLLIATLLTGGSLRLRLHYADRDQ